MTEGYARAAEGTYPTPTLEEAYVQHKMLVFRTCLNMLRDRDAAEDMTSIVFTHIATKLHRFKGEAKFSTWLVRVAVNLTLMQLRKRKANTFVSLEEMAESLDHAAEYQKAVSIKDSTLASVIEIGELNYALERLDSKHRLVVELAMQGFEMGEVALMLGISLPAVKSRLMRGKDMLAQALGTTSARPGRRDKGLNKVMAELERYTK